MESGKLKKLDLARNWCLLLSREAIGNYNPGSLERLNIKVSGFLVLTGRNCSTQDDEEHWFKKVCLPMFSSACLFHPPWLLKSFLNTALHSSNTKLTILLARHCAKALYTHYSLFCKHYQADTINLCFMGEFKEVKSVRFGPQNWWHSRNSSWLQSPRSLCKPTFYCLNSFSFAVMLFKDGRHISSAFMVQFWLHQQNQKGQCSFTKDLHHDMVLGEENITQGERTKGGTWSDTRAQCGLRSCSFAAFHYSTYSRW